MAANPKRRRLRREKAMAGNPRWCSICGLVIPDNTVNSHDDLYGTVDHVIPLSKGGPEHLDNRKPAHSKCNALKGNRLNMLPTQIEQLQTAVARKLNDRGIPTGPVQVRAASQRISLTPPGSRRLRGAPYMIAAWEDDGGAVAKF